MSKSLCLEQEECNMEEIMEAIYNSGYSTKEASEDGEDILLIIKNDIVMGVIKDNTYICAFENHEIRDSYLMNLVTDMGMVLDMVLIWTD